MDYAPFLRLYNKKAPNLTCTRPEDRYTKTTELGNGLLTHSVGLLTADEVIFAGGLVFNPNGNYYLARADNFWTSTPSDVINSRNNARIWYVANNANGAGFVSFSSSLDAVEGGARPVINLRADIEFTGNGSYETPYVITTN